MEKMKRIFLVMTAFSLLLFTLPVKTQANVQEISGLSPKAAAMGNAFSAIADDFSACYYNPAGLGQQDHHIMTIGYLYTQPMLKQYLLAPSGSLNYESEVSYHSLVFGTLVDVARIFNTRGHHFVLGVAATVGDNFKAAWRFHDWNPEVPRFIRYGDYGNRAHVYNGLGLEVLKETLYLGAGLNFWQDINVPAVNITMNLLNQQTTRKELQFYGQSEISPIAGVLVKPVPWLSLAYTYRGEWAQHIPMNITDTLTVGKLEIPLNIVLNAKDYFLPWNMTFGMAISASERLRFSLDVTYYHWSSFNQPMWVGLYPEWDNTVIPRFGVEYKVLKDLALRAGYYYEESPVPDQSTFQSNYLDFNKHAFSVGFGLTVTKIPFLGELPVSYPISVDAFFQYQYLEDRTQMKLTGQQSWKIEGNQIALGLGISTGF